MTQTFANHKRYVPGFHFLTGGLVALNFLWALHRLIRNPDADTISAVLVGIVLALLFWYTRQFALVPQTRIIRMEERLRLARLLPADLQPRIEDFTLAQLVALRFASDAEVPVLARRVLTENLVDSHAIKALITTWRADHLRV